MKKYKIIKGKLCDKKGNPVPLEIGNREQIEFIKKHQQLYHALKGDGLTIDVSATPRYIYEANFQCTCGEFVFIEEESNSDDDIGCLDNIFGSCMSCKASYILKLGSDGVLKAKANGEMGEMCCV